ncbi:MAG: hypothetical protein MJ252_18930 [archaeon]|nr:hypothetical protein [archaeon]
MKLYLLLCYSILINELISLKISHDQTYNIEEGQIKFINGNMIVNIKDNEKLNEKIKDNKQIQSLEIKGNKNKIKLIPNKKTEENKQNIKQNMETIKQNGNINEIQKNNIDSKNNNNISQQQIKQSHIR